MKNNPEDNFNVVFSEKEVEDLLSDAEWQDNIAEAAFVGALYAKRVNKSPEQIIEEIVRYNVVNKMRDFFLSKLKSLPKKVTWDKDYNPVQAFNFLENYICQVIMMKDAKILDDKITVSINIKDKSLLEQVIFWCDDFFSKYSSSIKMSYTIDTKNTHKISITFA